MGFVCRDESEALVLDTRHIANIYDKIIDDNSKEIFENRLLYSLTDNERHIADIVRGTEAGKELLGHLSGEYVIYGAGRRGMDLLNLCLDVRPQAYIDIKGGTDIDGIPVMMPDEYKYHNGTKIIISLRCGGEEVKKQLESRGIPEECIILFQDYWHKAQENIYFEPAYSEYISRALKRGAFLDVGSYDGKDSLRAQSFLGEGIDIYAFEPDRENAKRCLENLLNMKRVHFYEKGVSDRCGTTGMNASGEASRLSDEGDFMIETDTIDRIIGTAPVGYIKMDIEGSEEAALIGAASTIIRCKPVLAISIYHKRSDIYNIPMRILSINPQYVFALGHYTTNWGDTVLYAF